MRKREFLHLGEIHVYLLESQRALLRDLIVEKPEIPGLFGIEKTRLLREDSYVSSSVLGLLSDWFPDLIDDLRRLEIRRQAAVETNAALARRSI